jgi:hypothetical protein
MTDNHRQRNRRRLKREDGTKLRAQFIFQASTRVQLKRIACHKGCSVTSLIKEWAASAERRITAEEGQLPPCGSHLCNLTALSFRPVVVFCALPVSLWAIF